MAVHFNEDKKIFRLDTETSTYLMGLTPEGYLGHIYYGRRLSRSGGKYLLRTQEAPFMPSKNKREKSSFLDAFPMEYSFWGTGDYRESCLNVRTAGGHRGCELNYKNHRIIEGKPLMEGLPATFGDNCQTLEITCTDQVLNMDVVLSYSVFEDADVIIRSARVKNNGSDPIYLEKVLSACMDMEDKKTNME